MTHANRADARPNTTPYDVAIIGGGINGCGIARDATGRGLSVYLCEQDDLASGTSSWSTKLIHGGLRYLEHYEFRLVREALTEREQLWKIAPHIIRPLRFVLPVHKGLRPPWLLRLGLFLYDHLGGRKLLPPTRMLDMRSDKVGSVLKPDAKVGFEYSDCAVDDSRLVVLNAMDARSRGARIETRHKLISAIRDQDLWQLTILDIETGKQNQISARALINAAGPWVADVLSTKVKSETQARIRLVQGSHIVVKRRYEHDRAYIFQNADGRIIFAIPYHQDFTLIGTTDRDYHGDPADVRATDEEIDYLVSAANEYFIKPITRDDIVWSFSGVRPLYDDGASKAQEATRDYVLKRDAPKGLAPLISIFGGKITTYRRLAESVLQELSPSFPSLMKQKSWTASVALPGGNFAVDALGAEIEKLVHDYPAIERKILVRLFGTYGTRARLILGSAQDRNELGQWFGNDLSESEVRYLVQHEWARTGHDILWRRTKLGLTIDKMEQAKLDHYIEQLLAAPHAI